MCRDPIGNAKDTKLDGDQLRMDHAYRFHGLRLQVVRPASQPCDSGATIAQMHIDVLVSFLSMPETLQRVRCLQCLTSWPCRKYLMLKLWVRAHTMGAVVEYWEDCFVNMRTAETAQSHTSKCRDQTERDGGGNKLSRIPRSEDRRRLFNGQLNVQ